MEIGPLTQVKMHYTLTLANGEILESTAEGEPVEFIFGTGKIIPGLEKELEGMGIGEEKHIEVSPEEAYGERNPEAIVDIPKEEFPAQGPVEAGMMFKLQREDGMIMHVTVVESGEENLKLDLNHPLAGETLHFDVKIEGVSPPSG